MRRPAAVLALATAMRLLGTVRAGPIDGRQATTSVASAALSGSTASTQVPSTSASTGAASSTGSGSAITSIPTGAATTASANVWLSIDPDGVTKTMTPHVTTVNGVATTIDARPGEVEDATSPTASAAGSLPTSGGFAPCHDLSGPFWPFCQPNNGTDVYPGETYYITWNADALAPKNTTIQILLNYVSPGLSDGLQAWESEHTLNQFGFVSIQYQDAWLKGKPRNNLTFILMAADPNSDPQFRRGPTVSLTKKPVEHFKPSPDKAPSKLGLEVGLPIAGGFVVLVLFVMFFGMRGHRRIDIRSVIGSKRAGYGVGKSRRQRMKRRKKAGPIMLDDDVDHVRSGFRDEPVTGGDTIEMSDRSPRGRQHGQSHGRDDSLGSLADSPTRDGDYGARTTPRDGNAFRDEVERQKSGAGAFR